MEQDAIKEHVDYQHPLLCFKIWGFSIDPFQQFSWNAWHYHKEVEIVAVLEGKPVLDYVDAEYVNPIHIEDVLSLVHLEYHYFIKYFQKCIGMSFVDYLHFKRIKKAEHLLLTESLSIAEIGVQSGIPNNSQFIRIFKRYNECTPSQFRKNRIQIHVLPR